MHCVNETRIGDLDIVVIVIVTVLRLNLITVHADATNHPNVSSGALMSRTATHNPARNLFIFKVYKEQFCSELSL